MPQQARDYDNGNLIGWVDLRDNTCRFIQRKSRVEGFNLFGSMYIGPNNPVYPTDKPIYTLPAQDLVDNAAREHDKCYDKRVAKGEESATKDKSVLHCDDDLIKSCLEVAKVKILADISSIPNISPYIKKIASNSASEKELYETNTNTVDRAVLVAAFFTYTGVKKTYLGNDDNNLQKLSFSKSTVIPSEAGEQYEVKQGDYIEGEINNDGKIIYGTIYDEIGNVKAQIKKPFIEKRNH